MRHSALMFAALLALSSCGISDSDHEGISVRLVLEAPSPPAAEEGARHFVSDRGDRIHLSKASLTNDTFELLPCEPHPHAVDWRGLSRSFRGLFIATARAHHDTGDPLELHAGVVESLLAPSGERLEAGTFEPPPGAYCGLRHRAAPDHHASASAGDAHFTFIFEGTIEGAGGAPETQLRISTDRPFETELRFAPLHLSAEAATATLVLGKSLEGLFDGIDLQATEEGELIEALITKLQGALEVRVE